MVLLVNSTPDRIPADVVAEEREAARMQVEDFPEKEKVVGLRVREV